VTRNSGTEKKNTGNPGIPSGTFQSQEISENSPDLDFSNETSVIVDETDVIKKDRSFNEGSGPARKKPALSNTKIHDQQLPAKRNPDSGTQKNAAEKKYSIRVVELDAEEFE
jgi:hypothetical protein